VNANGISILGLVQKNSFDATKDLTPIAMIARSPVAFLIPSSLPVKTIKELVDYVKSRNNDFFYGSAGIGSINHLYGELFNQRAGIQMKHVPYRGFAEALPDLAAGRISLIFSSYATGAGMIKSGQLRLLAYGADTRPEGTPDAPSVKQSGIDYETSFWWALFGPGGMDKATRDKINAATNKAMKEESFQKLFLTSGVVPASLDADTFTAEVKKHYADLKAVVDNAKIVFE
jgi:tripartite-type tricarboxylate transporter receptor subunit TctC